MCKCIIADGSSFVQCLSNAADGVRLAARIVDTPCNEMNTDHFLDVSKNIYIYFLFWEYCWPDDRDVTDQAISVPGN